MLIEAAQATINARQLAGNPAGHAAPRGVIDSFACLGGAQCDGAIAAYCELAEMDSLAGDARYGVWETHAGLAHATFGLEARGVAIVGQVDEDASATASEGGESAAGESDEAATAEGSALLQTLQELWASPLCVAAGPFGLDYGLDCDPIDTNCGVDGGRGGPSAANDSPSIPRNTYCSREAQRRGMALLLRAAVGRGLPMILTCKGGPSAEADLARLALEALAKAPPPTPQPPPPTPQPPQAAAVSPRMPAAPRWRPCTPLLCHDAGGLWERLHMKWPGCAFAVFDGSLTYAKAARDLLSMAFDVPTERILLASAAPRCLPSRAGTTSDRRAT